MLSSIAVHGVSHAKCHSAFQNELFSSSGFLVTVLVHTVTELCVGTQSSLLASPRAPGKGLGRNPSSRTRCFRTKNPHPVCWTPLSSTAFRSIDLVFRHQVSTNPHQYTSHCGSHPQDPYCLVSLQMTGDFNFDHLSAWNYLLRWRHQGQRSSHYLRWQVAQGSQAPGATSPWHSWSSLWEQTLTKREHTAIVTVNAETDRLSLSH